MNENDIHQEEEKLIAVWLQRSKHKSLNELETHIHQKAIPYLYEHFATGFEKQGWNHLQNLKGKLDDA